MDKICTRCNTSKPSSDFHVRRASPDGLRPICKSCCKEVNAAHYLENREHKIKQVNEYRNNNRDKYNAYRRHLQARKEATDPNYKLARKLRLRIYQALKAKNSSKVGSAIKALGCTIPELRAHLEKLFQPGMTWENHGEWHIDHVKPLVSYNLSDPAQFAKACHFSNLQPLWAKDNLKKGAAEVRED